MTTRPNALQVFTILVALQACTPTVGESASPTEAVIYSPAFSARANAVIAEKGMKPGDGSDVWRDDDGCYWFYIPPTKPTFEGISFELFDREKDEWICD
jgi:hypothetical protein